MYICIYVAHTYYIHNVHTYHIRYRSEQQLQRQLEEMSGHMSELQRQMTTAQALLADLTKIDKKEENEEEEEVEK